jgi:hypothetical protein
MLRGFFLFFESEVQHFNFLREFVYNLRFVGVRYRVGFKIIFLGKRITNEIKRGK